MEKKNKEIVFEMISSDQGGNVKKPTFVPINEETEVIQKI